jgi:hypothetical protein
MTFPSTLISSPPQASAEVIVNEAFDSLSHQSCYAYKAATSSGLTWGYYGGRWGGTSIADGTLTLTNAATNYVVVDRGTRAISTSTAATNWNNWAKYARVYLLTTAGSVVTAVQDHRAGPLGVYGQLTSIENSTVASAATIAIPAGQKVVTISGTTGITSVTATGHSGHVVTLIFQGVLTVTDGSNLKLLSNFVTTADDTLTLACDGTNWFEVARSAN